MDSKTRPPILPAHIESTVRSIAQLHAEHNERATPVQRLMERATARAAQPAFGAAFTAVIVFWIGLNLLLSLFGVKPLDEAPFYWLQGAIGLTALYMALLILATQRRDDELASHREQLTLEIAILGEQKAAKIIELLEELRRDDPHIRNRIDHEAAAMAAPVDPQAVLEAIKGTHEGVQPSDNREVSSVS